jgi:hypothetical protein
MAVRQASASNESGRQMDFYTFIFFLGEWTAPPERVVGEVGIPTTATLIGQAKQAEFATKRPGLLAAHLV